MLFVGIDLGGTKVAAGIVDSSGILMNQSQIKTERKRGSNAVIEDMAMLAKKVIFDAGLEEKDIRGVGISIPATVDSQNGIIYNCNYIDLGEGTLSAKFRKYLDIPVFIENDGNAAAWAEHIVGSAKGAVHSITITLGTGIGGGIIVNNSIYRGFNGIAGEIGHMVIDTEGLPCICGRRNGCWEEYASAIALINQANEALKDHPESIMYEMIEGDPEKMDAKIPFCAARAGDEVGLKVIKDYIFYVAIGISNLLVIFQPEFLCIGGGISNEDEYLLAPIRDQVYREVYTIESSLKTKIKKTAFGNDSGIIGSAMLCRMHFS